MREREGERGRCPQSQRRSELRQSDDDTQPKLGGRAACRLWWSAIHLALAPVANQWGSHATSQCAPGQCKHSEQARRTHTLSARRRVAPQCSDPTCTAHTSRAHDRCAMPVCPDPGASQRCATHCSRMVLLVMGHSLFSALRLAMFTQ